MTEPLPLFVVTGFLGSGKTTLVQRYLRDPESAGTGVVVNEFGLAGLDHRLVVHAAEHVELVGAGCMCCARRTDVGRALYDLVRLARQGGRSRFSRAIVETSGLADPSPIVATLARDPWLRNNVRLAGVIAVVDAVAGLGNLANQSEARRQVAIADRLIVTKTDLRRAEDFRAVATAVREISPDILVEDAQEPDFSLTAIFSSDATAATSGMAGSRLRPGPAADIVHDRSVGSFTIDLAERIDWPAFTVWLSALLHAHGDRILRVKGLVRTSSGATPLVIHGVQHTMHPPVHLTGPDDGRPSFLVFITRDLDKASVDRSLHAFLSLAASAGIAPSSRHVHLNSPATIPGGQPDVAAA